MMLSALLLGQFFEGEMTKQAALDEVHRVAKVLRLELDERRSKIELRSGAFGRRFWEIRIGAARAKICADDGLIYQFQYVWPRGQSKVLPPLYFADQKEIDRYLYSAAHLFGVTGGLEDITRMSPGSGMRPRHGIVLQHLTQSEPRQLENASMRVDEYTGKLCWFNRRRFPVTEPCKNPIPADRALRAANEYHDKLLRKHPEWKVAPSHANAQDVRLTYSYPFYDPESLAPRHGFYFSGPRSFLPTLRPAFQIFFPEDFSQVFIDATTGKVMSGIPPLARFSKANE